MGNDQSSKPLSQDVFTKKLEAIGSNNNKNTKQTPGGDGDDMKSTPGEKKEISPMVDTYLIAAFNKKNNVFINIPDAQTLMFKLFFTNIILKGKRNNIEYLLSNKNDIILTFMHYVAVRKGDVLASKNENETLEIDLFIETFKQNKLKDFSFDLENTFNSEDKLDNIKSITQYKFDRFERDTNNGMVSWKVFNDTFLKYLITNQLNFCFDDKQCKSKDIMDEINLEILDILCELSFINNNLTGYAINTISTKHIMFDGSIEYTQGIQRKKVRMTSKKISSMFLIPSELGEGQFSNAQAMNNNPNPKEGADNELITFPINVITMRNPSSNSHLKEKVKFSKNISSKYCNFFQKGINS